MIRVLIIALGVLLFASCENRMQIKRDLNTLQSKRIVMPTDVIILIHGKDSVVNSFMNSELKLIVYANSDKCNPCIIEQMHTWNNLLSYAKGLNGRLKYYFIFSPKRKDELGVRFALKTNDFDYPVILDTNQEFERLNPHLPKNSQLHSFLLDEDNKVILVGNPLHNKQVEEMFYKIVEERLK